MRYRYTGTLPVIALIVMGTICGCASQKPAVPFPHPGCHPLPGIAERFGTLVVALTDPVDPLRAPDPGNSSERIVFRNLYETLVTVDCAGQVGPGLAESWTSAEDGRVWVFTLRKGARFWNGAEVLPGHVKWSWSSSQARHQTSRRPIPEVHPGMRELPIDFEATRPVGFPWRWLDARTDSVIGLDDRRLMVRLSAPVPSLFFAHPALAVADSRLIAGEPGLHHRWETPFPAGTGAYRVSDHRFDASDRGARDVICVPNEHHPEQPAGRLVFRVRAGRDARDLLAQDVHALLLRDRASEDYFAAAADFDAIPLPWDRIYILYSPETGEGWPPRGQGNEIARDVVSADARPADSILFGDAAEQDCTALLRATLDASASRASHRVETGRPQRILHDAADRDARSLAERLAFLADVGGPVVEIPPLAVGLPAAELASALRSGGDDAFVIGLERAFASDCLQLADLVASADGLGSVALEALARMAPDEDSAPVTASNLASELARSGILIPLVATRPHLAARRGVVGITVDADGALHFEHAGWMAGEQLP